MSSKFSNKLFIVIIINLFLIVGVFISGGISNADDKASVSKTNLAIPSDYNLIYGQFTDMGVDAYGVWEFEELDGFAWETRDDAYYIGSDFDKDSRYSLTLSMISPEFYLYENNSEYVFMLEYFSSRSDRLYGGKLEILATENGTEYYTLDTINNIYDNNGGSYNSYGITVNNRIKHIKLRAKVLYGCGENGGIFVRNINLKPKTLKNQTTPLFNITFDKYSFVAGDESKPQYSIECSDKDYEYYTVTKILKNGLVTEIKGKGDYTFYVLIFSADGKIVDISKNTFKVSPIVIDSLEVDYKAVGEIFYLREIKIFDDNGRDISGLVGEISYTLSGMGNERELNVTISESENNDVYTVSDLAVPNKDEDIVCAAAKQLFTYNGREVEIDYINTTSAVITFDYRNNNGEVFENALPVNAGFYEVFMKADGDAVCVVNVTILPKEITKIVNINEINKVFDGTYYLNNTDANDFTFEGLIPDDKTIQIKGLQTDRLEGTAKIITDDIYLGENYIYSPQLEDEMLCKIKKADLFLMSNSDENIEGEDKAILKVKEREYDGTDSAELDIDRVEGIYGNIDRAMLNFAGNYAGDIITADKINVKYNDQYAEQQKTAYLFYDNQIDLDRYNEAIKLADGVMVSGNINKKKISCILSESDIIIEDKIYDGTINADVTINSLKFEGILREDDLGEYGIKYEKASYLDANAANNKTVIITGIDFIAMPSADEKLLSCYKIKDISDGLSGNITKAVADINDEGFFIKANGTIPLNNTSPAGISLTFKYFQTYEDAGKNINSIINFTTANPGKYYIRAEMPISEINYKLSDDFIILPLTISEEKFNQTIISGISESYQHSNADGIFYKMAVGGRFNLQAYSETDGKRNNLILEYDLIQPEAIITKDGYSGIITAQKKGKATVKVYQAGDEYYNAAAALSITIEVIEADLKFKGDIDDLYYGQKTPAISGEASFVVDDDTDDTAGIFINPDVYLSTGKNEYIYTFNSSEKYLGTYSISVALTVNKAELKLEMANFEKEFSSNIKWNEFINEAIVVMGNYSRKLTKAKINNLNLDIVYDGYEELPIGSNTVYLYGEHEKLLTVTGSENYDVIFSNESDYITIDVVKSKVSIRLPNLSKFYGQKIIGNEDLRQKIIIDGSITNSDKDILLAALKFEINVDEKSYIGNYPLTAFAAFKDDNIRDEFNKKYTINFESGLYFVEPAEVTVIPNEISHIYGEMPSEITYRMQGVPTKEAQEEILKYINAACAVNMESPAGEYQISVSYLGTNPCYTVVVNNGTYTVRKAKLSGFFMDGHTVLYDGKPHSLTVSYDSAVWQDVQISYSAKSFINSGRYEIVATVEKENYETLVITGTLLIKAMTINTTNKVNDGQIILPDETTVGFNPDTVLVIERNIAADIGDKYSTMLKDTDTETETVWGVYDFYAFYEGNKLEIPAEEYTLKFKIDGITSKDGIKLLVIDSEGNAENLSYTFSDGYFTVNVKGFEQIAIAKTESNMVRDTSSMIIAVVIALILAFIISAVIISGFKTNRRKINRSKKKHSKWA